MGIKMAIKDVSILLYANDEAIIKNVRNINNVIKNIQEALQNVEKWSFEWGFKISVMMSCYTVHCSQEIQL